MEKTSVEVEADTAKSRRMWLETITGILLSEVQQSQSVS